MDVAKDNFARNAPAVESKCICERKQTHLMCINCFRTFYGRIHKQCKQHPSLIYLLDLDSCPCGGNLVEKLGEVQNGHKSRAH